MNTQSYKPNTEDALALAHAMKHHPNAVAIEMEPYNGRTITFAGLEHWIGIRGKGETSDVVWGKISEAAQTARHLYAKHLESAS